MRTTRTVLTGMVLAAAGTATASADVLVLHNGARERGVIVKESAEGYWLKTGVGMKMLYAMNEVREVQRESPEINEALRARWQRARSRAAAAPKVVQASPRAQAAPAEEVPLPEIADGDFLAKKDRYGYITGGGFKAGVSTPRDVSDVMGTPDRRSTGESGETIWMYDVGGGDAMCMSFANVEGKTVLVSSWHVSDYKQEEAIEEAEAAFKEIHE